MMTNNYLLLKFKTARLFRKSGTNNKNYKTTDRSFDVVNNSHKDRDDLSAFIEPITVHQVSNMIHVLFNERPVSTVRGNFYEKNNYLFDKAKNSYLKINNLKKLNKTSNKEEYFTEVTQVKKAVYNSWNPSISSLNWELIRRYIDNDEKFNVFINNLKVALNIDATKITFNEVSKRVLNLDVQTRLSLYESIKNLKGCDGLTYALGRYNKGVFESPKYSSISSALNRLALTVNNGLEKVYVFSGEIVVPVSDDDLDKIKKYSKGYANILDGGLVWIEKIIPERKFNSDDYLPVGKISLETTIPFNNKT